MTISGSTNTKLC